MYDFEKFPVYIAAEEFYKSILSIIEDKLISRSLRDQLSRASVSIMLNIAEGAGRYSKKDKRSFYTIARGSTQECVSILKVFLIQGDISKESYKSFYSDLEKISRMLSGLIKRMSA